MQGETLLVSVDAAITPELLEKIIELNPPKIGDECYHTYGINELITEIVCDRYTRSLTRIHDSFEYKYCFMGSDNHWEHVVPAHAVKQWIGE